MPASTAAIMKNVERLKDQALIDLWNKAATEDRTPGQAWAAFIEAADSLRLAHQIPGSVGRSFRAKYAEDKATGDTPGAAAPEPAARAPRARKAASGRAQGSVGSKAGGSGRIASKAAQSGRKQATK